jgi:hypothetical protein
MLSEHRAKGFSDIAASLDEPRRRVTADLFICYPGR